MKKYNYIPAIDSLRAIAAIMVVIEHSREFVCFYGWKETSFLGNTNLGFGVDLFYVISGFVVYSSILPHISELKNNFKAFWISFLTRRFFRLAPVCLFWLTVILFFSHQQADKHFLDYRSTLKEVTGIIFYLYNYMCAYGFYLTKNHPFYLGYHYSLNTEEQFYFLLPLLLFCIRGRIFFIVSIMIVLAGFFFKRPLVWYYFRYDSFFYGILFAQIFHFLQAQSFQISPLFKTIFQKFIGPALLWAAIYHLIYTHYYLINHQLFESAATYGLLTLIIVCLGAKPLIIERFDYYLVYIGQRSYALYLAHIPTFFILNGIIIKLHWAKDHTTLSTTFNTTETLFITMSVIAILWLLVEFSYRYIETPWRNFGKKISSYYIHRQYTQNKTTPKQGIYSLANS